MCLQLCCLQIVFLFIICLVSFHLRTQFDEFWLTIIFSFKKTHYLIFNTTCGFFIGSGIQLINQSYQLCQVLFVNVLFFFRVYHIQICQICRQIHRYVYRYINWFKIIFQFYYTILYLSNSIIVELFIFIFLISQMIHPYIL